MNQEFSATDEEKNVTTTFTFWLEYFPTITNTPARTPIPANTPNADQSRKAAGFYTVEPEISPGVRRLLGLGDDYCWAITSKTGNLLENNHDITSGTMCVPASGWLVELDQGCGFWEFFGE